jgi:thiamine biosynthesis lipoprotein
MITKFRGKLGLFTAAAFALALAPRGLGARTGSALAAGPGTPSAPADRVIERTHEAMGTIVTIKAWAEDEDATVRAFAEAFAEFDRIDRLMTTWIDDSDVSKINAAAGSGKAIKVSAEVIQVLEAAREASRLTGGAFDVTVGGFFGVWKFDQDRDDTIPDDATVAARLKLVGWKDLVVDKKKSSARLKRKGQRITLGGIAKGYAVDRAVSLLRKRGLVDFVVQAGGDMFVAGQRGDRKWRVGIRDPRGAHDDFFALAEVKDMTFSTSGDYERFVIKDGKRYHHILDPRTGRPATACRSVTVMAGSAMLAEGLTKGIFILGPEKGFAIIDQIPGAGAVVVDAKNKVHVSSRLEKQVVIRHDPTDGL